jgi:23S rRNA pseudouridine955/2504/2580 synthase/23S rRNA pseudouridine1911/1915/1917 synthase
MKSKQDELQIIYEDRSTLVVNKPSGLLSVPDRYDPDKPNLCTMLRTDRPDGDVMLVHRLDRGASGVMLFAKGRESQRFYSGQFAKRRVGKVYAAIVRGASGEMAGTVHKALRQHPNGQRRMVADEPGGLGKDASTGYEIVERFGGYAFVRAVPREGYQHQVRVHLAEAGMPVVGDQRYGDGRPLLLSDIKRKYRPGRRDESPLIGRLALHAYRLLIAGHPDGDPHVFVSDLPSDFQMALRNLYRYGAGRSAAGAKDAVEALHTRLADATVRE